MVRDQTHYEGDGCPDHVPPDLDVRARVAAGIVWLDEHVPDWAGRIDVETLDLGECKRCVLGQLFGHYTSSVDELGDADPFDLGLNAVEYRLYWLSPTDDAEAWAPVKREFDALTEVWREEIAARKASHV